MLEHSAHDSIIMHFRPLVKYLAHSLCPETLKFPVGPCIEPSGRFRASGRVALSAGRLQVGLTGALLPHREQIAKVDDAVIFDCAEVLGYQV